MEPSMRVPFQTILCPTDLSDTDRFLTVWDDLNKRNALGRITCFDVSSDELDKYFQLQ